jgi:hypothetical protein
MSLLSIVRDHRKTLAQSVEQRSPEWLLKTLVDDWAQLFCESPSDANAVARVFALTMCPAPTPERVAGAAELLAAAGFGEVGADELHRVYGHQAYKKFDQLFHKRLPNGQTEHGAGLDLDAHYQLSALAVEACA